MAQLLHLISIFIRASRNINDMNEPIGLPQIVEKLVSPSFSFIRPPDQSGNVNHLDGNEPLVIYAEALPRIALPVEFLVNAVNRHKAYPFVRLDCCKWVTCYFTLCQRARLEKS